MDDLRSQLQTLRSLFEDVRDAAYTGLAHLDRLGTDETYGPEKELTFGANKGKKLGEVQTSYLRWMEQYMKDPRWAEGARRELSRRARMNNP